LILAGLRAEIKGKEVLTLMVHEHHGGITANKGILFFSIFIGRSKSSPHMKYDECDNLPWIKLP